MTSKEKYDLHMKQSFVSPQKPQTSIRDSTNNKQAQKRLNNNLSPQKLLPPSKNNPKEVPLPESPPILKKTNTVSPLSRSFLAITNSRSASPGKSKSTAKSDNYFQALSSAEEEELDLSIQEGEEESDTSQSMTVINEKNMEKDKSR
jgi:hypothetical protein